MTPIPSTKYYYTDGKDIFRKLKDGRMRPLRECKNRCYTLSVDNKRIMATKAKFIWCADHMIAPTDIDAKFAFTMIDGVANAVMFADKIASVRVKESLRTKASISDYDFIIKFAQTAKAHLKGEEGAASQLWQMLNSRRDGFIAYALNYVGKDKAIQLTDTAIIRVFEQTIKGVRAIPSPVASIKCEIRKKAIEGYKTRELRANDYDH